jgi:hypothetical protein
VREGGAVTGWSEGGGPTAGSSAGLDGERVEPGDQGGRAAAAAASEPEDEGQPALLRSNDDRPTTTTAACPHDSHPHTPLPSSFLTSIASGRIAPHHPLPTAPRPAGKHPSLGCVGLPARLLPSPPLSFRSRGTLSLLGRRGESVDHAICLLRTPSSLPSPPASSPVRPTTPGHDARPDGGSRLASSDDGRCVVLPRL